jgi:MFS transporter, PPP family, 3-phenylpropionic acid transporter
MRSLKVQFFLSYAILGSLTPLLTVFLKDQKGLDEQQIGLAMSMSGAANLLSPVVMTLLADTKLQTRHILALSYAATSVVLLTMLTTTPVAVTLALMALYGLSIVAMFPLQDGMFFAAEREHERLGTEVVPYTGVRVWGTVGFILPSVAMWWIVGRVGNETPAVLGAVSFCLASLLNALFTLPAVRPSRAPGGQARVPTFDALRVLARPETRWLCLALIIAAGSSVTYHYFFPIYLKERIGLRPGLIPLVINVGVLLEVFYTLAYPRLIKWIGAKGILIGGLACMVSRLWLLGSFPSLPVAILVQLGHGLEIVSMFVLPPMLLNRLAGDAFRNSMQGAFSMMMGAARLSGSILAGIAVKHDMLDAMQGAAAIGCLALVLVLVCFRPAKADSQPGMNA